MPKVALFLLPGPLATVSTAAPPFPFMGSIHEPLAGDKPLPTTDSHHMVTIWSRLGERG